MKKPGIKRGQRLIILGAPDAYEQTLGELPDGIDIAEKLSGTFDFLHFFTMERGEYERHFPDLKVALALDGTLWVSWPKRTANMLNDLDGNIIREFGLAKGLADVKVYAAGG